ncbi:MAG TPA: NHLP family bacteriocin export ABC transporter peptidase/permease/ATPase subunit, partial [Kofleriaceae bacterium]|nr:NHLP family bacteriocin export ABC transporter peptidase/permease/ATPase subunit [Kofleriaceae bacterium]
MEAVECGAAALGIVLGHFGRYVPLELLRIECGVSRDGSKTGNVLRVARKFGLEAKAYKMEVEGIRASEPPLIVFWNFNHFLVVEGFGRNKVHLNDPSTGPRTVSLEEFDRSFTGVVLSFRPGPNFTPGGERESLAASLGGRLRGSRIAFTFVVATGIALIGPGLLVPTLGRVLVDEVLVGGAVLWAPAILLSLALTAVLRGALVALQKRYLGRLETRLALSMASRFMWHVLRLPVEFFTQRYAGDVTQRVLLNDQVARLLSGDLAANVLNLFTIAFYAAILILYDRVLGLFCVAVAVINMILLYRVARRRADQNLALQLDIARLHSTGIGGLQTIETIKATGSEAEFFARWTGFQAKVINGQQRFGQATVMLAAAPPLLSSLATIATLGLGALRVMDGQLSMGLLVAFQSLMASFLLPVNELVRLASTLQEAHSGLRRLDDALRYRLDDAWAGEPALAAPADELAASDERATDDRAADDRAADDRAGGDATGARLGGLVELRGVTFGYNRLEPPLIEGFDLTLRPGSRVALVGGSGSGKSTIARLVAGLYRPWSGEIRFDGQPRSAVPRAVQAQGMAMVDQEIFLFEGSVRDNLTLWDATLPEAQILEAARDAEIHDDIAARPGGYDHIVEEGGRNFSGGQRQRLEIARALVTRPAILVLDEATSALDTETERAVQQAFDMLAEGRTTITIAHRLSTVRAADQIVVL